MPHHHRGVSLLLLLRLAASQHESQVVWRFPEYGALLAIDGSLDSAPMISNGSVRVRFDVVPRWPKGAMMAFEVAGQMGLEVMEPTDSVVLKKVEPGTVVVSAQLQDPESRSPLGPVTSTTFEATLTRAEVERHSHRPGRQAPLYPPAALPSRQQPIRGSSAAPPIKVTFVGMLKMDGQKMIWLQQMRFFQRETAAGNQSVALSYLTFDDAPVADDAAAAAKNRLVQRIRDLGVRLDKRPMPSISFDELHQGLFDEPDDWWLHAQEDYGDGLPVSPSDMEQLRQRQRRRPARRLSVAEVEANLPTSQDELNPILLGVIARAGGIDGIIERGRRDITAGHAADPWAGPSAAASSSAGVVGLAAAIDLPWARTVWLHLVRGVAAHAPDVLLFANARETSDLLLAAAARLAGVPRLVMDLPNLFPLTNIPVDAFVAPSHYAARHPSVAAAVAATGSPVHVISPGVNTSDFSPSAPQQVLCHPANCDDPRPQTKPARAGGPFRCGCPVVGFLARLSTEKSPGLFVATAAALALERPDVRFLVVGDGPLLESLKDMAARVMLRYNSTAASRGGGAGDGRGDGGDGPKVVPLAEKMHFTGGIYSGLPSVLAGIDVMVNPSLRAWSETFCIVNVEAMAMQIPVVSFGVGGVREYLVDNDNDGGGGGGGDDDGKGGAGSGAGECAKSNGVIVKDPSPKTLADAVGRLLSNATLRRSLGEQGREAALGRFTIEHMNRQYLELYRGLLAGPSRAR